ncbi:hypothetical protein MNBD_IGNAVI01-650 [hydrothermal vent metagenome]|uniref:FrrB n=1 Tax=hydrothermal vent metagenome TaxID=652676 RepID=A0A3B1C613_9ZZZZ
MNYKQFSFYLVSFIMISSVLTSSLAQSKLNIGADLMSRYVWRGTDYGQSPSIQPTINFTTGELEFGIWGAYQLGRDASELPADELDLYLGYILNLGSTSLGFIATDYYFPNSGGRFGNFDNDGKGAHVVELGAIFTLPASIPIYFSGYINVYNDPDYSSYYEVGYSTSIHEVNFDLFIGAASGGENKYYGTKNFNIINTGITASKSIKVTEDFSLPIFVSYIINPNQNQGHFIFGISI